MPGYQPGRSIVLARLPARDWFSIDQAAEASGWSRSFIRGQIKAGRLPAQSYRKPDRRNGRPYYVYRIHIDDLASWILANTGEGSRFYTEEKPFRDICLIIRFWPAWMRKELIRHLQSTVATSTRQPSTTPATDELG